MKANFSKLEGMAKDSTDDIIMKMQNGCGVLCGFQKQMLSEKSREKEINLSKINCDKSNNKIKINEFYFY